MLRLHASTAGGMGLIPTWGTKILHQYMPCCLAGGKKKREMARARHNKNQGHRLEEGQKRKAVVKDGRRALGGENRQQLKFRVQSNHEETSGCEIHANILRTMGQAYRTKHSAAGV